ncbi:MAG: cation-transporting P-type ATPase, partial [Ilumatobacteraceae bacterium]
SVTVICTDKTGTLTQNVMTATTFDVADRTIAIDPGRSDSFPTWPTGAQLMAVAGVLCNDGHLDVDADGVPALTGDPTETALLRVAHDAGLDIAAVRAQAPRTGELPFDSSRKRMSTIHDGAVLDVVTRPPLPRADRVAFVKGAVDGLVDRTAMVWTDDGPVPFDERWRRRVIAANDRMASDGMRVLAVAMRSFEPETADDDLIAGAESDLTLLGLVGIIDPPRPEVRAAVAQCRSAGIRSVMITGDHPLTALAIARELGMVRPAEAQSDAHGDAAGSGTVLMTGLDIDRATDTEFDRAVATVSVFARVTPEHKLRIVEALQRQHQVVAMTGDGVNDAPALKRSDIGVAMGITGTDVSKEASDMVLRDDNFTTIVAAVEEGRVIYDNLRRFVSFAVAGNLGKIIVMLGWPIPYLLAGGDMDTAVALLPLQLLWLNLMTDGLLGLSMGVEPAEPNVMRRAPHRPGASLWVDGLGRRTIWIGVAIGLSALGVGIWYHERELVQWQTMIFTTLAVMQVFQAFATRSQTESLRRIGWTSNPALLAVAAVVVGLQLVAIYSPLSGLLKLEPLTAIDLIVCVAFGAALLIGLEVVKAIERRHPTSPTSSEAPITTPTEEVSV